MPKTPKSALPTSPPSFAGTDERDLAYAMMAKSAPLPAVTPEPHAPVRPRVANRVKVTRAVKKPSARVKKP